MSEDEPRIRICQDHTGKALSKVGPMHYDKLFEIVNRETGHGNPTFKTALERMVGAGLVSKKPLRKIYELTEKGRKQFP